MFVNDVKWVRIFDVPDIAKHRKGFTIYKVISMLYPENCPDAVTKITVWKRFNEFKTLHKDIKILHKSLKIRNTLPQFPTASYFKRFDDDVIQQRKIAILSLLEFISQHAQLFTSNVFVKFFESSQNSTDGEIIVDESDDNCTLSDDTDSLSTVSSSMIQLSEDTSRADEYPISFKLFVGDLQFYACELFGNSLGGDLIESEYINHADCFCDLAAEIESTHREFKVAWKHYMQGIYVLLKYSKSDRNFDRKLTARFKLEKYFIRIERLFYMNLYEGVKNYIANNYGEAFAHVALADLSNLHFDQLFDLQTFEATPLVASSDNDLLIRIELGQFVLVSYSIKATADINRLYDTDDFLLLANTFENEQNFAAAYVNYKMAFSNVHHSGRYFKNEPKDLTYLLRNEKYVYRGNELVTTDKEQKTVDAPSTNIRRRKHGELYKYKIVELVDEDTMLVTNDGTENQCLIRIVQKTVAFSCDSLLFPKHVPYMTKLLKWHHTEDAVFLLFNYTKATNLKDHLLTIATTHCDQTDRKVMPVNHETNITESEQSDDFEFLDLPGSTCSNSFDESDEYDACDEVTQRFLPMSKVRRWVAQIVLAIERLHKCGVYCCELSMDDLRIDDNDNILINYKCKIGDKKVYSYKEYSNALAPEVYTFEMITPSSDWWSLGIIIYEILVGYSVTSINPEGFYSYPVVSLPKNLPQDAKSLIKQLLVIEPNMRLGNAGAEQVKLHPFFNTIVWHTL